MINHAICPDPKGTAVEYKAKQITGKIETSVIFKGAFSQILACFEVCQ